MSQNVDHKARFVTEGFFMALSPGFPGVASPLPLETTRLIRLANPSRQGMIFAAGAGPNPRVFQFMPQAPYGYTASWVEPGEEILGIETLEFDERCYVVLLIRSSEGLKLALRKSVRTSEGIQEWMVVIPREKHDIDLSEETNGSMVVVEAQCLVHVVDGKKLHTVHVDADHGFQVVNQSNYEGDGQLVRLDGGNIVCVDIKRGAIFLLENGGFSQIEQTPEIREAQALTGCGQHLVWAGANGQIFSWHVADRKLSRHGTVGLSPVTALTRLPNGRFYGFAGDGIAHWFCLDHSSSQEPIQAVDLGVATSVLTERRYGFEFSAIVCGSGGELYCAESDRGGHLWMYFPPQKKSG